ncbi:MAG: nuclear transport factor 2 family protein [Deltaproteobacteria bacterium]|nr:nuclear transport factor 2 family protein [Deltaproteobacteria bacterium]
MKNIWTPALFLLFLVISPAVSTAESVGDLQAARSIKVVLETFVRGESAQSVEILEEVLDPAFSMTAVLGGKVVVFSREGFLGGIAAKKFGGNNNPLTIESLEIDGPTAAVEMRIEGPNVRFHHYATLAFSEGTWALVHSLVTMTQPG